MYEFQQVRPVGRWTRALEWAAKLEGRVFRGRALDGDPPAHLDPGGICKAANDVIPLVSHDTGMPAPRGMWPLRRNYA